MKSIRFILVLCMISEISTAQIIDPQKTAERKATQRANSKVDRSIDKGLDKIEEGIGSIFKKKDKKSKMDDNQQESNKEKSAEKISENKPINSPETVVAASKSSSKFDFEPGNKILYFDNFDRLSIGDFPAEFNTNASGEVVNISNKSGKWLSLTKNGAFVPENIKELPENFTLEFEAGLIGDPSNNYSGLALNFTTNKTQLLKDVFFGKGSSILYLHPGADLTSIKIIPGSDGEEINNDLPMPQWSQNGKRFAKISIWRQKGRVRLYVDENKLVDSPRFFAETKPYHFAFSRRFFGECQLLITNIRLAVAGEDTRSKLITEGKLVTNGILFDVNSDIIKPESGTILKEIAGTLQENPTIRVKITGHTDSDDNRNLVLSQKRALAVRNAFINYYGIDGSRMETDGKGESQPVQSNNTTEGKAQNRRVEFTKL